MKRGGDLEGAADLRSQIPPAQRQSRYDAARAATDNMGRRGPQDRTPRTFTRQWVSTNIPAADIHDWRNTFFILPVEPLEWIDNSYPADAIDLTQLGHEIDALESSGHLANFSNNQRVDHQEDFARNEMVRLLLTKGGAPMVDDIFPSLEHVVNPSREEFEYSLYIPSNDVRDLQVYLFHYLIWGLTQRAIPNSDHGNYIISYSLDDGRTIIPFRNGAWPMTIKNGVVKRNQITDMYYTLMREFAKLLPDRNNTPDDYAVTWRGAEDSGTRIRLYQLGQLAPISVHLYFTPARGARHSHKWSQAVEDAIMNNVGRSVMSVRNRNDNKCLVYCIIMGLMLKYKRGGSQVFGRGTTMVEDYTVYARASMYFQDDDDEVTQLIRRLADTLLPRPYGDQMITTPLQQFVHDIDCRKPTVMSIAGFREEFELYEKTLIPNGFCGIDVYGIDYNINKHVYPLYISKTRGKVLELLCITPKGQQCSHYCVITNKEELMKQSAGKQFFSCSKCGETFYHRRLLTEHQCAVVLGRQVDGYHYSVMNADPRMDIEVGHCPKCRLTFISDFQYEYHKEHCLMKGYTGYRHVQLVQYNSATNPVLSGVELDEEGEKKHVERRRMMYADFESSINPETGEHTFMSYGIYEWKTGEYKCGYDLKEFIDFILEVAFEGSEDHIYVYFHNAMGYDANFILRHILGNQEYNDWGIQVIMKSSNRLQKLVFYVRNGDKSRSIHICDTFLFLTLSLERIVDSIRKDDLETNKHNFTRFFEIFQKRYPGVPEEEIDHILRKNIFPYKFFTDSSKLDTPIDEFLAIFEPKEENVKFFSERVGIEDLAASYGDNKHVIETFRCRDARDYHDLYLCCDVLQLADVFDRSMKILWESHHIHLTRYLGMPSASWAAFLRHDPQMKIPLYTDTFFAEFFKEMIRGGITSAPLRHAVADERHSIIYLDVNGLYPYVMQAYLFPTGDFHFVPLGYSGEACHWWLEAKFREFESTQTGMCFCVDLHIPQSVKELTDMYPFAPEHRRIYKEYYTDLDSKKMTPFLERWSAANNGETMKEFIGLVCTLYDKTKYNIHWRVLKFYMEHGVEVKRIYFGVQFEEGDYLAGYIRKNIAIRNGRKDELGKTLYKLLGNSIYGKTFESPFKRNTYEIVRDLTKLQGLMEEGDIASMVPIDDLGWIVKLDGEDIILDKPTYIGACVCEFSKLHMYTLLYDKLMKIFPGTPEDPGCQLVYTDTDSFIVKVRHPDEIGSGPAELFRYIKSQDPDLIGGIGGQVKSETGEDDTIKEIIALRSKVYAYVTWGGHHDKRAKGTTHDAQLMQLDWDKYKQVLEHLTSYSTVNNQFLRETFKISSVELLKQSLSCNDGKRDILEDGIHTHAFGYSN